MCTSADGLPGTISAPVPVATRTSLRHRERWNAAKCWATPPPQEIPSTSTRL
jgi:hypothetical protein